jgi:hypothetical protein
MSDVHISQICSGDPPMWPHAMHQLPMLSTAMARDHVIAASTGMGAITPKFTYFALGLPQTPPCWKYVTAFSPLSSEMTEVMQPPAQLRELVSTSIQLRRHLQARVRGAAVDDPRG